MGRPDPARFAGLAAVLGVAVLCAFWGITVRDLADTELDEFAGSGPMGILRRSISPQQGDWGAHMPLSHLIRWHLVRWFGEQSPLAWRLHSAIGVVGAAGLAWWAVARQGRLVLALAAGLLVALHPVASFHAHESTNYALGPFLGGLLLLALFAWDQGRPKASFLLAAAVLLGLFNDLFFVFLVGFAFLWTAGRALGLGPPAEGMKRRFLVTWGTVGLALLGPALWFLRHLLALDGEQIIGPHADPIPPENAGIVGAAWDLTTRFAGGYLGGYLDAGVWDPWLTWTPVAVLVLMGIVAARIRTPGLELLRMAAWMVLGSFGLILAVRIGFGLLFEREFTTEPRIYSAFIIPLALGWVGTCAAIGRRAGLIAIGGLLLAVGIPTARQLANLSDRDSRAVATIVAHHRPGDLVLANRQVRWRLPPRFGGDDVSECAPGPESALPDRIWIARPEDGQRLPEVPICDSPSYGLLASGQWQLRHHARWFPPDYDRKSASFLPELTVFLFERGAPRHPPGTEVPITLQFDRGPFSAGSSEAEARLLLQPDLDGRPDDGAEPHTLSRPWADQVSFTAPVGAWVRVDGRPPRGPESSLWGLLEPLDRPFVEMDPVPVLADPIEPVRVVPVPAFTLPGLLVFERLLRALLAIGLAFGIGLALIRRRV